MNSGSEFFACGSFGIKLTRASCAKRHVRANRRAYPGQERTEMYTTCKPCAIGQMHAAGTKPDVMVTAMVQKARAA